MYVRVGSGVAGPVCRRVWMECPGETRLSGIAWVWVGVCGGSAPLERCVEMLLTICVQRSVTLSTLQILRIACMFSFDWTLV